MSDNIHEESGLEQAAVTPEKAQEQTAIPKDDVLKDENIEKVTDPKVQEPEAKAEPETKAEPKAEPETKAKPKAEPETKAEPEPEAEPVAKPEPETKVESEPKAETETKAEPEAKPEPKPEAKPEPKPEAKPEPKKAPQPEKKPKGKPAPEPKAEPVPEKPVKKKKKHRGLKITAFLLVLLLAGIYGGGVYYYGTHFHHNTAINGTPVGEMDVREAEKVFTEDFASHKIQIIEKERTEEIDAVAVGTVIDVGDQVRLLQESQNKWTWFLDLFEEDNNEIDLDVSYDEAKLKEYVDQMECFSKDNVIAPEDAYIKQGETAFEIVPEVLGNTVKKNKLLKLIGKDLTEGVTEINLEEADLYKLPKVYEKDKDIQKALKKANKFSAGTITYDFDYTTVPLDYKTTKDWIDISDDFKVSLNESDVGDYVESLAAEYNTMGTARDFTTQNGEKIHVADGDYGWKIDFLKEKEKLIKDLKSGKDVSREPVWAYTALVHNGRRDDIGDTYVEVSISQQEVWMVVDGKCVMNSSCVTGDPTRHADTDKGVYSITFKKSPATLTGPNADGSSYASEVTYWMPFNGNQGLHDAKWRNSFGGSEYKGHGSHGCVNLPFSAAQAIWNNVQENYPVVIY